MEVIKEVKSTYLFLNHHLRISVIQMDLLPYPVKKTDGKTIVNYEIMTSDISVPVSVAQSVARRIGYLTSLASKRGL